MQQRLTLTLITLCIFLFTLPAHAQIKDDNTNQFLSHEGTLIYLGTGVGRPLLNRGGREEFLRTSDALITSTLLCEGIKYLTKEKRPNSDEHNSFPSGHTTAAFAVATIQSHYHRNEAPLWYLGAALIGQSRVGLKRHYWHDVIVGALLGYAVARWELSRSRGLLASPFLRNGDSGGGGRSFSFSARF